MSSQRQIFASIATIRAAIFDLLDQGRPLSGDAPIFETWRFHSDESDEETEKRGQFADLVIARIAELQFPPHSGVKLENLCDFHKRRALPAPTASACVVCEAERKVKNDGRHG